ncbi:hypothetical protein N6Y36_01210 [Morganella morganii]|nr:hypothetical protein N6Y36_01210 [Morganella morganii]
MSDTESRLRLKNNLYSRLTLNGYPLNSSGGGVPVYVRGDYEANALLKSTQPPGRWKPGLLSVIYPLL